MSKQTGNFGADEIERTNRPGKKRKGPWEVWHCYRNTWSRKFKETGDDYRESRMRSYETKELAEQNAAKYTRDWAFSKNSHRFEVRYNGD